MVVLNVLINVYHAEPEYFDDWVSDSFNCQIIDFNWNAMCMFSHMEYCF